MDHLHRCHKRLHSLFFSAKQPVRFFHQHRAQTFSTSPYAVVHGLKNGFLVSFFLGQITLNNRFYLSGSLLQFFMHLHLPLPLPAG